MTGQDLYSEMSQLRKKLNKAQEAFLKNGKDYAQAEHDYEVAFAKELLIQKDNGVAVTILDKVVKGTPHIAKLKLELNIAETMYKAADKAIDSYKLQMRIINDQISREHGRAD